MTYLQTIIKILTIYFTSFPYDHYNRTNQESNFGLNGISCALIYAQQQFWLAIIGSIIFIYNKKNIEYFYFNMAILLLSLFLFIDSLYKAIKFVKFV